MAQNIIFPNGPLFMVDRGWKNPHNESAVQVVPSWGKKKSQIPIPHLKELPMEGAAFERDTTHIGSAPEPSVPSPSAQKFEFVNIAGSFQDRAPEVRKLVRSHVMKGSHRNQKPQRKPVRKSRALSTTPQISSPTHKYGKSVTETAFSSEMSLVLPGSATSFYGVQPCVMEPHYYGLLNYCM
jgi:hypothetical protein